MWLMIGSKKIDSSSTNLLRKNSSYIKKLKDKSNHKKCARERGLSCSMGNDSENISDESNII